MVVAMTTTEEVETTKKTTPNTVKVARTTKKIQRVRIVAVILKMPAQRATSSSLRST